MKLKNLTLVEPGQKLIFITSRPEDYMLASKKIEVTLDKIIKRASGKVDYLLSCSKNFNLLVGEENYGKTWGFLEK